MGNLHEPSIRGTDRFLAVTVYRTPGNTSANCEVAEFSQGGQGREATAGRD